jgi:hypothetical protein
MKGEKNNFSFRKKRRRKKKPGNLGVRAEIIMRVTKGLFRI